MRLTEVFTSDHRIRYVVLDDQGELVIPLVKYLKHLDQRGYALNTLRSYGISLMLFFEYLNQRDVDFRQITLDTLAGFVSWLKLFLLMKPGPTGPLFDHTNGTQVV